MIYLKPLLKNFLDESVSNNNLLKRNLLKEYLQVIVLDFMYSHPDYSRLYFYGGSCLKQCFDLPRLSEDLDFVDVEKKIDLSALAKDLSDYFNDKTDLKVNATIQKFRIYLKFPLLFELGLGKQKETDLLFLKVEIFSQFDFCTNFETEYRAIFRFYHPILVKTFDLPTLMATKIRAVLHRKWEKTDKSGQTLATVKGRDYFDLMWYLEKGVKPNLKCIEGVSDMHDLKNKLLAAIDKVDERSIRLDLEALIENENYILNLSKNLKQILARSISEKL